MEDGKKEVFSLGGQVLDEEIGVFGFSSQMTVYKWKNVGTHSGGGLCVGSERVVPRWIDLLVSSPKV